MLLSLKHEKAKHKYTHVPVILLVDATSTQNAKDGTRIISTNSSPPFPCRGHANRGCLKNWIHENSGKAFPSFSAPSQGHHPIFLCASGWKVRGQTNPDLASTIGTPNSPICNTRTAPIKMPTSDNRTKRGMPGPYRQNPAFFLRKQMAAVAV